MRLLVCKDQCVPEKADIQLALPVTAAPKADPQWGGAIAKTIADVPKPAGLTAVWAMSGQTLRLAVTRSVRHRLAAPARRLRLARGKVREAL